MLWMPLTVRGYRGTGEDAGFLCTYLLRDPTNVVRRSLACDYGRRFVRLYSLFVIQAVEDGGTYSP